MNDLPEANSDDLVINVKLPYKDYLILRRMIDDQTAIDGVKSWFKSKFHLLIWIGGGLLTLTGLYNFFVQFKGTH